MPVTTLLLDQNGVVNELKDLPGAKLKIKGKRYVAVHYQREETSISIIRIVDMDTKLDFTPNELQAKGIAQAVSFYEYKHRKVENASTDGT